MDTELRNQYDLLIGLIEKPIREIVPAIWDLPFVLDTGHTCSGHILAQRSAAYGGEEGYWPADRRLGWYPHRAILELAFSVEKATTAIRDEFRRELKAVSAEKDGIKIFFDDNWRASEEIYLPAFTSETPNLREKYQATVPENLPRTNDSVVLVESLLTDFWKQVAAVVRKYNPDAEIGSIEGRNFREVINWDHWRTTQLREKCIWPLKPRTAPYKP